MNNLVKNILHLKDEKEYQIPLNEKRWWDEQAEKQAAEWAAKQKEKGHKVTPEELEDKKKTISYQLRKANGDSDAEIEAKEEADEAGKAVSQAKKDSKKAKEEHNDATKKVSDTSRASIAAQKEVDKAEWNGDEQGQANAQVTADKANADNEQAKADAKAAKEKSQKADDDLHAAQQNLQNKRQAMKSDTITQDEVDDAEKKVDLKDVEQDEEEGETTSESKPSEPQSNTVSADTVDSALSQMISLAQQEGVIHPSNFIQNFSKILSLLEQAMRLKIKEGGSATPEQKEQPAENKTETTPTKESN